MKKFCLVIFAFSVWLGFACSAFAAPAPTLFVYNDTTKECGTFRDGDEYVSYNLPKAWQTYDYSKSTAKTTQEYCDELGYKNIGSVVQYLNLQPETIRTRLTGTSAKTSILKCLAYIVLIIIFTVAVIIVITILAKRKREPTNKPLS